MHPYNQDTSYNHAVKKRSVVDGFDVYNDDDKENLNQNKNKENTENEHELNKKNKNGNIKEKNIKKAV